MRADECLPSGHKVSDQQLSIIARPSPLGAGLDRAGGRSISDKSPVSRWKRGSEPGPRGLHCCLLRGVYHFPATPRRPDGVVLNFLDHK